MYQAYKLGCKYGVSLCTYRYICLVLSSKVIPVLIHSSIPFNFLCGIVWVCCNLLRLNYNVVLHAPTFTCTGLSHTTLYALLVPACAVLLLLIVGAAIVICVKRRRRKHSVAAKSLDRNIMKSTNLDIEQGFIDNCEAVNYSLILKTLEAAVCN